MYKRNNNNNIAISWIKNKIYEILIKQIERSA